MIRSDSGGRSETEIWTDEEAEVFNVWLEVNGGEEGQDRSSEDKSG